MRLLLLLLTTVAMAQEWVVEGSPQSITIAANELRFFPDANYPDWVHTAGEHADFRLTFEYKLAQWAEAAVVIRAPRLGRPVQSGIAIALQDDYHPGVSFFMTGAVLGIEPPRNPKRFGYNQWQQAEIIAAGDRLTVRIDGGEKQSLDLAAHPELKLRPKRGFIGFPAMGYGYTVRNVKLEDRGGAQYTALQPDGKLTNWTLREGTGGQWTVQDGVLKGADGDGILYAPGEFQDFELSALIRGHGRVNGGIFLRGAPEKAKHRGFEVQVYNGPDSIYPTGSIYNIARSRISADHEGQWFFLQVFLQGERCLVRINGETVSQTDKLPEWVPRGPGRIGIQIHKPNSSIEVRELRVRKL